jgi:hypothetical protein
MLTNQYVVNVLSDFITLTITALIGVTLYRITGRRKLQAFFGIRDKRVVIYLSNLNVPLGGALDHRGQRRSYGGDAIPEYEARLVPVFYRLFNAQVPGLKDFPGILKRLRFSDIEVEIQAAPPSASDVEQKSTFVAVGSHGYNAATEAIEKQFNPTTRVDPNGFVVMSENHPFGDSSFAVVQRLRDSSTGQSAFYLAGSSSQGTTAAVRFLVTNWSDLHRRHPRGEAFCKIVQALSSDGQRYRQVL